MKESQVKCRDYVGGLARVDHAIERSTRAGIKFRNMPDQLLLKAQFLFQKGLSEGDHSLLDEADILFTHGLDLLENQGIKAKLVMYTATYAKFLKLAGKDEAFQSIKLKLMEMVQGGSFAHIKLPWDEP